MKRLILNSLIIVALAVSAAFTSCENNGETKLREFTVTFESNGGSFVEDKTVKKDERALKPTPDPTKNGYTFAEWFKEEALTTEWKFDVDVVSSNMKLYAKWIEDGNESDVYTGKIISKGNPCPPSDFPCVPAVVLWLETTSGDYVLSIDSHWILGDKIVVDEVEYLIDDEVEITGTRTVWQDMHSKEYFNLEIETIKRITSIENMTYVKTELGGCNTKSALKSDDSETEEGDDKIVISILEESVHVFVGLNYICCAPFETKIETKDDALHMYIIDTCNFGVDECYCKCMCYYTFDFVFTHRGKFNQKYKVLLLDPRNENQVVISEGTIVGNE